MSQDNPSVLRRKVERKARLISDESMGRFRKARWRLANGRAAQTVPLYIVGAQRSGTTMLGDCLGRSPEIENLGESDSRAFHKYTLLDDITVRGVISDCPCPHIVLKPLKDSHRIINLLNMQPDSRAVWAYRHFADRINSAIREFGRHPLDVFEQFKATGYRSWQLIEMSPDDEELLLSLDYGDLTLADGAALMWYIRNALFFNAKLSEDPRIRLCSYDVFVTDPKTELTKITDFIGARYFPYMTSSVHSKSIGKNPHPEIDPGINELCVKMFDRLEDARKAQADSQLT